VVPQPAFERKTAKLSAKVKSRRKGRGVTFTVSGKLELPAGVRKADGCAGRVTIRIKAGKRTIANRRDELSKDCRYKKEVTFRKPRLFGDARKVRIFAVFEGNKVLKPKKAEKRTAKVRLKRAG